MFERIRNVFSARQGELTNAEQRTNYSSTERFVLGLDLADGGGNSITNPYLQHITVFRCIMLISTSMARIDYEVIKNRKPLTEGPLIDLLDQPNDLMSRFEFFVTVSTDLHFAGNAMIYVDDPDSNGIPRSLFPIPPHLLKPVRGKGLYELEGWMYKVGQSKEVPIPPEKIIHLKYAPHPFDRLMGVSPMQVAKIAIDADYAALLYNRAMLASGGTPPGILTYKGERILTEEAKEEIRQQFNRTYGGPRESIKVAVVNNEWAWQNTGAAAKDMEFLDSRRWNLADISRAFNVPLMYLNEQERSGLGDAGIRTERRRFYEDNIVPLGKSFEGALNRGLLSKIEKGLTGRFVFHKVEALRDDYTRKVEAASNLAKMGWSINSLNRSLELGLEDMPWGDEHVSPVNMVPIQDIIDHTVQLPAQEKETSPQADDANNNLSVDTGSGSSEAPKKKEAASIDWSEMTEEIDGVSGRCTNRMRRLYMKYRTSVIASLSDGMTADQVATCIDGSRIAESAMPFIVQAYCRGVQESYPQQVLGERAMKSAGLYAETRFKDLSDIGAELSEAIKSAILDLDAIDPTRESSLRRIRKIFNRMTSRAEEVARMEVFAAYNRARFSSLLDGRWTLTWVASPMSKCGHEKLDGEQIIKGATFTEGVRHPGDLERVVTFGCDCTFAITLKNQS